MTAIKTSPAVKDFHLRWPSLGQPQRPTEGVAEAMKRLLAKSPAPLLQLGVTPEIAHIGGEGLAVDWSEDMIRTAWPGNSDTHKAILADWHEMPFAGFSMGAVFGDGCLSVLAWPVEYCRLFQEIERVIRPGGRLVLRCFTGPEDGGSIEDIVAAAFAGQFPSFGAFKLQFNITAYRFAGVSTSAEIHRLFQKYFPDRDELARRTGWTLAAIANIDAYEGGLSVHTYPTRSQITGLLPANTAHGFVETSGYPMAACCPLLVADFAKA